MDPANLKRHVTLVPVMPLVMDVVVLVVVSLMFFLTTAFVRL
jgi:hypothetical protein